MLFLVNKYEISEEANEMEEDESVSLQTSMGSEQKSVLIQREVLKISRVRNNRKRSLRLVNRKAALRRLLYPESPDAAAFPSREAYPLNRRKVWSREDESSDDEPLSHKVARAAILESFSHAEALEEDEPSLDDGEWSDGEEVASDAGSNFGERSGYEEEYVLSSEEESDEESDDEPIFQGRSMVPLRQQLVSDFFR
jgi:hypothetical protein